MTKNSKMRKAQKIDINTELSHFLRHFAYKYFLGALSQKLYFKNTSRILILFLAYFFWGKI